MFSDQIFSKIFKDCSAYTMTSPEKMYALYKAIEYLEANKIEGSFVECGVWRGGSIMVMLRTLTERNFAERHIEIFDLFDLPDRHGNRYWNSVSQKEVQFNIQSTGYPQDKVEITPGDILVTLEPSYESKIALLRLDTDLLETTAHSLDLLYPFVTPGGIVIIDDYGSHPDGAGRAVDEFFKKHSLTPFLGRIDGGGRIFVKP